MEPRLLIRTAASRLTVRYVLSLLVIAMLLVGGQALVQYDLGIQATDSHVINIAGRQRMLSQRLAKAALAIRFAADPGTRNMRVVELDNVVTLWAQCQQGLRNGDASLGLPGNNSYRVRTLFASIEPQHQIIVDAAHSLVTSVRDQQARSTPDPGWSPYVQRILEEETSYLPGMDAIVTAYDRESVARVSRLRSTELVLLIVALCVLVLEGLFIFRPAVKQIFNAFDELAAAQSYISSQSFEIAERDRAIEMGQGEIARQQDHLASLESRLIEVNTMLRR